uniref:Arrestin_C domain-containing protein n=1 Tax=Syphacia muris TaxID=451379 RepID=A0A0N5AXP4_9BILA
MERSRKPFEVKIYLSQNIYNPGDTLQGEVVLELRRKMFCDLVTVQLYGAARVFFVSSEAENGTRCPIANEQKKVLLDEKKILWGTKSRASKLQKPTLEEIVKNASSLSIHPKKLQLDEDDSGFEAGTHSLQFTFDLPKSGLSVSYADHTCSVRYYIKVQCYNYQQLIAISKCEFPVVCPLSLSTIPEAITGSKVHETIPLKKGNSIDVTMKLDHCGFVPQEKIPVSIRISNNSLHSIKYAHLTIAQEICCFGVYPFPNSVEYETDTTGSLYYIPNLYYANLYCVGLPISKILAGQSFEYIPDFYVPALVPNFELDNLLKLCYSLKLIISYQRKCTSRKDILGTIKIPIYIGTEPIKGTKTAQPPNPETYLHNRFVQGHQNYDKELSPGSSPEIVLNSYLLVLKCCGLFCPPPTAPPGYMDDSDYESHSFDNENSCPSYNSLFCTDKTVLLSDTKTK